MKCLPRCNANPHIDVAQQTCGAGCSLHNSDVAMQTCGTACTAYTAIKWQLLLVVQLVGNNGDQQCACNSTAKPRSPISSAFKSGVPCLNHSAKICNIALFGVRDASGMNEETSLYSLMLTDFNYTLHRLVLRSLKYSFLSSFGQGSAYHLRL